MKEKQLMRYLALFFLFLILFGGCATTRDHACDGCTLGIQTIKEGHIPQLASDECTWGMARFLAEDITEFVNSGRATFDDLGVIPAWVTHRVRAAQLNDISRAKRELKRWRGGGSPDYFQIRAAVVTGACTWEYLGVTTEEQKLIEEFFAAPTSTASN
jgi:hypothetical protein